MKNLKSEDRKINTNNVYYLDRIGSSDTVETGQSLTIGTEYRKTNNIEHTMF